MSSLLPPGWAHLIVGALLVVAGIGVTLTSKDVVWYGAIVVGVIEVGVGLHAVTRGPTPNLTNDDE